MKDRIISKVNTIENENSSFLISSLDKIEVNEYNVEVFLAVYKNNFIELTNEINRLKKENKLLNSNSKQLFSENYELKRDKIILEAEKEKLEFIITHIQGSFSKNESQTVKNSLNDSKIASNRDTKIGDELVVGNQQTIIYLSLNKEDYKLNVNSNCKTNNNMALIETATAYILGIITENEEVKKFPKDFVSASMKWIRSWFLEDDPVTKSIVENPALPEAVKSPVIEAKLKSLEGNTTFMQELTAKLQEFSQHQTNSKNVIEKSNITAEGSVHIGDLGNNPNDNYSEKNIVKDSTIKAGKDFRLGDG